MRSAVTLAPTSFFGDAAFQSRIIRYPALAPAGEHVVMVQGPAARESGEAPHDDRQIAEDLLSYAEDVLPGLREHITFVEPAADEAPASHRRYSEWVRSAG